jgi:hypothetical protein
LVGVGSEFEIAALVCFFATPVTTICSEGCFLVEVNEAPTDPQELGSERHQNRGIGAGPDGFSVLSLCIRLHVREPV